LDQEVPIGQRDKPQHSELGDPTGFVLVPPFPPQNPLPHVKNTPVRKVVAAIEPERVSVNRDG
jgi:hypothetical protein